MKRVPVIVHKVVNPITFDMDMTEGIKRFFMKKYPAIKGFEENNFETYALVENDESGTLFALKYTNKEIT
jgi:hypothetical protein